MQQIVDMNVGDTNAREGRSFRSSYVLTLLFHFWNDSLPVLVQ